LPITGGGGVDSPLRDIAGESKKVGSDFGRKMRRRRTNQPKHS